MAGDDADRLREAEERGDADALYELAADLDKRGDAELAERACRAAADLGHPGAMHTFAHILYERDDRDRAVEWWARAADAGDAESAFNAGVASEDAGRRDDAIAFYRRAADDGHARAHANIGILLEHEGDGLAAEDAYRTGMEAGDSGAAYNLGVLLYRRGDDDGARAAFDRAADLGDDDAAGIMDRLDADPDEPDDYDREAIEVMREHGGADPSKPLPVQHWMYVPGEEAARTVAYHAAREGFAVEGGPIDDEGTWGVRATRHMSPRPEAFARARHPLVAYAHEAGGEYDGWEAPREGEP